MKYSLGIDVGSSSVKVAILDIEKGNSIGSAQYPQTELPIIAPQEGWAEQDPDIWWDSFLKALQILSKETNAKTSDIGSIGISYQMHGLVLVDKENKVLRPSIIWCDSRATGIGNRAFKDLGMLYCHQHLLNSPGNFTASKLRWVREHEPAVFEKVRHFMLPGDFIALKLTGTATTTLSGLSEGIFWDFKTQQVSDKLLDYYGIAETMVPQIVPTFGIQGEVSTEAAAQTGIKVNTPVSYRAGDQPNNALSLNVLEPGEIAATAGTSGVIYGVTDKNVGDEASRINTFLHVNNGKDEIRNGVLLCINGTGILNSWLKNKWGGNQMDYPEINQLISDVPVGSGGVMFFPFGNGAERILKNQFPKASLTGIDFNRHGAKNVYRAAQEGIVFALKYGFDLLSSLGVNGNTIRAGMANMFLSPVFREAFVNTIGVKVELYETNGAEGAARGAAFGAGYYPSLDKAFTGLRCRESMIPSTDLMETYNAHYLKWKDHMEAMLQNTN